MSAGAAAPRGHDAPVPGASARAAPVDDAGTPRATYRRQCRKQSVAGSIVEAEEEVDEPTIVGARRQSIRVEIRRSKSIADVESQHERRADRHAQSESARTEDAAARRRLRPRAPVIDEERALHARKPRRPEWETDGQEVENREPVLGVHEPGARAGHVAVLRIAAQAPRAGDADAPRPLAARGVALDAQRDGAVLRRPHVLAPVRRHEPRVEPAVTQIVHEPG